MAEQEEAITASETSMATKQTSNEATIESHALGGTESACNDAVNNSGGEASDERLKLAAELTEKGTSAFKDNDFAEAAECFSRALEIRVSHYGEIALECLTAYYQYGRALLYKAQEEADPLGNVPNKDGQAKQESDKEGSVKSLKSESSATTAVSSNTEEDGKSDSVHQGGAADDASGGKDEEEEGEDSEDEDLAEADEDDSDLDLAWKMLDVARAIAEKHSGDTMDKVDVLSALAEVALEREDIETSLSDYKKALLILQRLVEPDSRHLAELNFRICLCLEVGSKPQEAISYCQNALSICKSRVQRLMQEVKGSESAISSVSRSDDGAQQSSNGADTDKSLADKESEIKTLTDLSEDLEKKLEDLQQLAVNPKSILSEILGIASAKAKSAKKASSVEMKSSQIATAGSSGAFDSPTNSTAHTSSTSSVVTHLGIVGRGVKRTLMTPTSSESSLGKKPAVDPSADKEEVDSH